ncbi:zinc ribbon domain-containing protein [Terrisporobacter petrolearius]|uniref:zinc ribbon domain-containing protein n=1 Tax=Terrisporobacter petrolearius TaxID=1460447 RepID=UPI0031CCCDE8
MVEIKKDSSEIQVCSKCGEINYDGVNFCQDCGGMLNDFTHVFCEVCGAKNSIENKTCTECKNIL